MSEEEIAGYIFMGGLICIMIGALLVGLSHLIAEWLA